MKKESLQEKLAKRKIKRPSRILYLLLGYLWKALYQKRLNVHFEKKIDIKKLKGPFIVISNHASRLDYIYTGIPFLPHRMNYVAGYNEFFRSHLAFIFKLLQIIPKKNFTPDINTIKQIARILRKKGKVVVFPEGMSSISGTNQPSAIGSGKLLKHFKVPVYICKIAGGYLTNTKYCLDERRGKVEVTIDQLFNKEDLETMSEEQIQLAIDKAIAHNDYEWNKTAKIAYKANGRIAHHLHDLLYWCPKCHHEFHMEGKEDTIICHHCNNGAMLDEYYQFHPLRADCVIPYTPVEWIKQERELVKKQILDPDFQLEEHVKLGILPSDHLLNDLKTSEIVGEGILKLDRTGLSFDGVKNNEPYHFHMDSNHLPTYGMCIDVTFFSTYYNEEYVEFFPDNSVVYKWLLATEEIHRLNGGKWKDFPK